MAKKAKTRQDGRKGGQRSSAGRRGKAGARSGGVRRRGAVAKKTSPKGKGVGGAELFRFFPKLLSAGCHEGQGVLVARADRDEKRLQLRAVCLEEGVARKGRRSESHAAPWKDAAALARLLHGLAHVQRLEILVAIRRGARRHQDLKAAVGLAAGPLYHHLRDLERSGLVACLARNNYTLTDVGHSSLLLAAGLEALSGDARRARPWRARRYQIRIAGRQDTKRTKHKRA